MSQKSILQHVLTSKKQVFFMGGAAFIDEDIPKDAVKVMYVKNISGAN